MYLVVEINSVNESIAQVNAEILEPTKVLETVVNLRNYCDAILSGEKPCTIKVVTKDAQTTINTSGTDSQSVTFSRL